MRPANSFLLLLDLSLEGRMSSTGTPSLRRHLRVFLTPLGRLRPQPDLHKPLRSDISHQHHRHLRFSAPTLPRKPHKSVSPFPLISLSPRLWPLCHQRNHASDSPVANPPSRRSVNLRLRTLYRQNWSVRRWRCSLGRKAERRQKG